MHISPISSGFNSSSVPGFTIFIKESGIGTPMLSHLDSSRGIIVTPAVASVIPKAVLTLVLLL